MLRSLRIASWTLLTLVGCNQLDYEFEGRYVAVGTAVVDRVCEGTLAQLDRDVEFVDDSLGFEHPNDRIEIEVLPAVEAGASCNLLGVSCAHDRVGGGYATIRAQSFESARIHELVHVRVFDEANPGTVMLFSEGIAVAVDHARCKPEDEEWPSADDLLAAMSGKELGFATGYYLGGELVAWLLETHGPERVLAFMDELRRPDLTTYTTEPEQVRALYREHFGSEFDFDLYAHLRDTTSLNPALLGCIAPKIPREGEQLRLQAELDCGSEQVQNDFRMPGRGYVEWTLEVPETARYRLLGELPEETWLAVVPCTCDLYPVSLRRAEVSWSSETKVGASAELAAGTYLVHWYGPYDRGSVLDLEVGIEPAA